MITPENYYLEYKKISSLFNEKYIYILLVTIAIPMLLLIYNIQTYKILILPLALYVYIVFQCLKKFASFIKKNKINKLKKLINNEPDITSDNFEREYQNYILNNLKQILNKNNISPEIYESFYRNHLSNYLSVNKNIIGDNLYVPFILGSIYVGTIQAFYNLIVSIEDIIVVLGTIVFISLFIIWMLYEIKQFTHSKYNDISKLIFYTEMIFQEQKQKSEKKSTLHNINASGGI